MAKTGSSFLINIRDDGETLPQDEQKEENSWSLDDFEFGTAIAKGCSAVVYSARLKKSEVCVHVYSVHARGPHA